MKFIRKGLDKIADKLVPHDSILGKFTMILGVSMSIFGMPSQIVKNYINQICGLSFWLIVLLLAMFSVRIPYTISKKAYSLLPADFLGFIFALVLIFQWCIY